MPVGGNGAETGGCPRGNDGNGRGGRLREDILEGFDAILDIGLENKN